MTNYPIDHLVLPTADLAVAAARLSALGFTVAPAGVHPFGTVNCCVYLADGTFLEPLAVGDAAAAALAVRAGNVFVSRDASYRMRQGEEGFSAVVFGTADAAADHERFKQHGISVGEMLEFSRPFVDAAGRSAIAGFRLAFAADRGQQDVFFFTCERVNAPQVDRSRLERHLNGVSGLKNVVISAENPFSFSMLFQYLVNSHEVLTGHSGVEVAARNGTISILEPSEAESRFGIGPACGGLRPCAAVFAVADLIALERLLKRGEISYERRGHRIVVPRAPGQGATIAFEASE
jgi:Glyoxalase-like domain